MQEPNLEEHRLRLILEVLNDLKAAAGSRFPEDLLREILDKVVAGLGEEAGSSLESAAMLRSVVGSAYLKIHEAGKAEAMYRGALGLRRQLHGEDHGAVADALRDLRTALLELGQTKEAEATFREEAALRKKIAAETPGEAPPTIGLAPERPRQLELESRGLGRTIQVKPAREKGPSPSTLEHLRRLVEKKSGGPCLVCDAPTLDSVMRLTVAPKNHADRRRAIALEAFNEQCNRFLSHEQVGGYLRNLTPRRFYTASGFKVLPLDAIAREIHEERLGGRLFLEGCLVFAMSFHDNYLCFHLPSGRVVWACSDYFLSENVTYQDASTGEWRFVPFTRANVEKAVIAVSDSIAAFLNDFLNERMLDRLRELG